RWASRERAGTRAWPRCTRANRTSRIRLPRPAQTDGGPFRLCPAPVYTRVDLVHERTDLHFLRVRSVEVRLAEQRTGKEDGRVDRRQLTVLEAFAALHVQEVVEEAPVTGHTSRVGSLPSGRKEAHGRED